MTPCNSDAMQPDTERVRREPDVLEEEAVSHARGRDDAPWKVILYNDNVHAFSEVIAQLKKATGCSHAEAAHMAIEAHVKGRAVAFTGSFTACFRVSACLREINLITQMEG